MAASETTTARPKSARAAFSAKTTLRKIVFVSYGPFDCNSGGHIFGFANALVAKGYSVAVCATGDISAAYSFGTPAFEFFTVEDFARRPDAVVGFDGEFRPERTLIICWTPREIVRRAMAPFARHGVRYVVHLEDNEEHLTRLRSARSGRWGFGRNGVPDGASDPKKLDAFLAGAVGVTVITERLLETLPCCLPAIVLEPGVDLAAFGSPLTPHRRSTIRRGLDVPDDAAMLVYPGNVHRANVEEVGRLYDAVALLRRRGRKVALVRTGMDHVKNKDFAGRASSASVIALGQVDRPFLIELMKCADLFVQPGAPGPFNDFRLPSKLPEFMAVGRPIILPATNIGARLRDADDALLLHEGSAEEIAAAVERVLSDTKMNARLATNARAFAAAAFDWEKQAGKLEAFLHQVA